VRKGCNPLILCPCLRGVSFIGRKKKEFVTMHDDVGLGSASESVRFLYRGKLILYSLKKSICKE
jgi:hypothetical protein